MCFNLFHELLGEQATGMFSPVVSGIGNDCVEFALGIIAKPAPSIINNNVYLRVVQDRLYRVITRDDSLAISSINLNSGNSLDVRVVCKDLSPCSPGESNDENLFGRRMNSRKEIWPHHPGTSFEFSPDVTVINPPAIDFTVLINGDDTKPALHDEVKALIMLVFGLHLQAFIKSVKEIWCKEEDSYSYRCSRY